MKALSTLLLTALATVVVGVTPFAGEGQTRAATKTEAAKPKLTKDQRRANRAKKVAERATAATKLKVREGKSPNYNRLLKSTEYKLMYTEGLRYFNMKKRGSQRNSLANLRRAQTLFATVAQQSALSGTPQEDSLYFYYGASYFVAQDYQASQDIFDNFRRRYGSSRFIEQVEYMYASGFYELSPDPRNDQSITIRGISAISEFMGRYPDTEHRAICEQRLEILRRKLYTKSYENARLYYTIGKYNAAVRAINNAIDEYPQSPFREELMYLATRSAYLYAKNSVPAQMTNRYLTMMDNYYNLVSEYPETRHLREVEQMRDEARKHIEASTTTKNASESSTTTL
jgi:outer membrane protein assembly factor BamD